MKLYKYIVGSISLISCLIVSSSENNAFALKTIKSGYNPFIKSISWKLQVNKIPLDEQFIFLKFRLLNHNTKKESIFDISLKPFQNDGEIYFFFYPQKEISPKLFARVDVIPQWDQQKIKAAIDKIKNKEIIIFNTNIFSTTIPIEDKLLGSFAFFSFSELKENFGKEFLILKIIDPELSKKEVPEQWQCLEANHISPSGKYPIHFSLFLTVNLKEEKSSELLLPFAKTNKQSSTTLNDD